MVKTKGKNIKVLISYADPTVKHNGSIYQATNWLYQGEGLNLMPNYSVSLTKPYEWIHSKTVFSRFGSHNIEKLGKIGHTFLENERIRKHRYVYFLGNKKENKLFISNLKYQKLTYPKVGDIKIEITEHKVKEKKGFMSNSLWVEKYRPNTLENTSVMNILNQRSKII